MAELEYYRPSRKCSPATLVVGIPVGGAVAVACGWAGQKAILALPDAFVVVGSTLAAGAVVGLTLAGLGYLFRCQRRSVLLFLALLCAVVADIAGWHVAYDHAKRHGMTWVESDLDRVRRQADDLSRSLLDRSPEEYTTARTESVWPRRLRDYLDFRLRHGWPERGNESPAVVVILAWVGELGSLMWAAAFLATALMYRRPICAEHNARMRLRELGRVSRVDYGELKAAVEREDLLSVLQVARLPGSDREAVYAALECPHCERAWLGVTVHWREGALGSRKHQTDPVLPLVRITREQLEEAEGRFAEDAGAR